MRGLEMPIGLVKGQPLPQCPWTIYVILDTDFLSYKMRCFNQDLGDLWWRRQWQPTPVFLLGESQGRWSLVDCHLWGRTESDITDVT